MSNENVNRRSDEEPRYNTSSSKGFYDNTYKKMLAKAGRTYTPAWKIETGFHRDAKRIREVRPEYNAGFKNPIDQ